MVQLGMKDEDWIYVFPPVTPEIQEDDGETATDDGVSDGNEDSEDETAEGTHCEITGAVTADELGTVITSEPRIISLIEAELDFVNRNLHLVVTKAPDGRTNMFISTQSKDIPIPPAPRRDRLASAVLDAHGGGNAASGDTPVQDDPFNAYQELTTIGSESPEFVPGSRPGHNHKTTAKSTKPDTRPTGLGRPTKTGTDRAPYGSKKAARTKKQENALADAAAASRTLQAEAGDNAAEIASHSGAAFDPAISGFNPDNIDPQLAGLVPYSGLSQAGVALQPEYNNFLDEEDRTLLDANAHFGNITDLSIPRMTQADLDAQFPSDVIVPTTLQRDQNIVYHDQGAKGETHTPALDYASDEANADMDTDTSMLDAEAEEQAILNANTTYIDAIKYIDPDYAASVMGGSKLAQKPARASKSKTKRTPQKAPRAAAKPRNAASGNGVSRCKKGSQVQGQGGC